MEDKKTELIVITKDELIELIKSVLRSELRKVTKNLKNTDGRTIRWVLSRKISLRLERSIHSLINYFEIDLDEPVESHIHELKSLRNVGKKTIEELDALLNNNPICHDGI